MEMHGEATGDLSSVSCKVVEIDGDHSGLESEIGDEAGSPDGFNFILPFLDLQSRLTMERVSTSLRDAVRYNPLVWQHLHVERPAVRNLTDQILLTLVRRAEGQLKCLSLTQSLRTTEKALEEILALNPGLEQLSVPGCTGISAEGIVKLLEAHSLKARAKGLPGIKRVQIRGFYNITKDQLNRLHEVLQPVGHQQDPTKKVLRPQYYGNGSDALRKLDARPIDVEVCPSCSNVRVVYDCTTECKENVESPPCYGCTFCIPRCEECGCCIKGLSYDESLCSDLVCSDCWFGLPKCSDCNRAVCGRHAHQFIPGGGNTFTCEECLSEDSDYFGVDRER